MNVTTSSVKLLGRHLRDEYDVKIGSKSDSQLMRLVAAFLDGLGIMDHRTFLAGYGTTIGDHIYLPFELGASEPAPIDQVAMLAHELQHIILRRNYGESKYDLEYIGKKARRAMFEATCYTTTMEVYFLWSRTVKGKGEIITLNMRDILNPYAVDSRAAKAAQNVIDAAARATRRGGIATEAAQAVGKWYGWLS